MSKKVIAMLAIESLSIAVQVELNQYYILLLNAYNKLKNSM